MSSLGDRRTLQPARPEVLLVEDRVKCFGDSCMVIPPFPPHAKTIEAVGGQATLSHHRVSGDLAEQTRTMLGEGSQRLCSQASMAESLCQSGLIGE